MVGLSVSKGTRKTRPVADLINEGNTSAQNEPRTEWNAEIFFMPSS